MDQITEVWYVQGHGTYLFTTKEYAEKFARALYPDADPDARYALIFSRPVYGE